LATNSSIDSRVGKVEGALESLHQDVAGIKIELRNISNNVALGFAEMRKDQSSGKQTNWGWIAAFMGVSVAILGFVTTSMLQPLKTFDEEIGSRMNRVQERAETAWQTSIRNDERLKFIEYRFAGQQITK